MRKFVNILWDVCGSINKTNCCRGGPWREISDCQWRTQLLYQKRISPTRRNFVRKLGSCRYTAVLEDSKSTVQLTWSSEVPQLYSAEKAHRGSRMISACRLDYICMHSLTSLTIPVSCVPADVQIFNCCAYTMRVTPDVNYRDNIDDAYTALSVQWTRAELCTVFLLFNVCKVSHLTSTAYTAPCLVTRDSKAYLPGERGCDGIGRRGAASSD